jgi:hypothetical protein
MDIVSVAAPKRRRRRKQEVAMDQLTDPSTDPLFVAEEPIDQPAFVECVDTQSKGRDIGNWVYRPWNGRDHWQNKKTHRSLFDERAVRKARFE